MARVLLLSPYHGGSHQAFAEGLQHHSSHTCDLLTLPARFWKWRMRGAAMLLAHRCRRLAHRPDLVLATDMMNLAEFRALSGLADVPAFLYFHENQLAYPLPEHDQPDFHFGFINLASALAADALGFNSQSHREAFLGAVPGHLAAMPDCPLPDPVSRLRRNSHVLPVGCALHTLRRQAADAATAGPPVILWNHRWEFDKAPEVFFQVLDQLADEGLPFRLILVGENSQVEPRPFLQARQRHADRLLRFGYVEDRQAYARLLGQADIVVSTAIQENFGVAMVEAMACGAWPLLPDRLSYPEVLPARWHAPCLYSDPSDLASRLRRLLQGELPGREQRQALSDAMLVYDWSALIGSYDDLVAGLVARNRPQGH